ncbi:MAG: winged helix-turn-helix transcriptional regulator [Candidatus Micrarchaeota archaeon]|nr:winged helix-turn-helix transcriptional regulator [Candidatus Micrarchaeota archaeon]
MQFDNLDEKIMAYLDNNSRISNIAISKALHVNKNVINYRIKNLEFSGVILGYYSIINFYALGYQGYRLYLKFQYTDQKKEMEIMNYFHKPKNIWLAAHVKGRWDMAILFCVRNQNELVHTINGFLAIYRDCIKEHIVTVYYGICHYRYPFTKKHLKSGSRFDYLAVGKIIQIDKLDHQLLKLISTDGRASLVKLAKNLKLSPGAVNYRLKYLMSKNILAGFRAIFDDEKLGYSLYKLDMTVDSKETMDAICLYAKEHDYIYYLNYSLGYADVEIEVRAHDQHQFFIVLNELRSVFSGKIRSYDFFIVDKISILKYMPESQVNDELSV